MKSIHFEITVFLLLAISIGALLLLNNSQIEIDTENEIAEYMIEYDKYFMPYLYNIILKDNTETSTYIGDLTDAWHDLESKLTNKITDPEIQEDIFLAKQWLFDSFKIHDSKEHNYVCLDLSRFYLIEARTKLEIDYYLDYLWQFEASLELVHEPATDPKFCLLEYCELSTLVNDLNRDWNRFNEAIPEQFLLSTFNLNYKDINIKKNKLRNALRQFHIAMDSAMGDQIADSADNLDLAYLEFLGTFNNAKRDNETALLGFSNRGKSPLLRKAQ